jgi:hypothetical protein
MKVYQAINKVQAALAKTGIAKDRTNTFDKYQFRGIDDIYNALSPLLAEHGLCILPRILKRESIERESQKGGALFYVTVEAEFDFVAAEDGSKHTVRTFGEAMDRGDKATNKAMSAAYKYAAFQAFAIPTEGDNDADAQTHQVKPTVIKATDGIETHLTAEQRQEMDSIAAYMVECHESGKDLDAIRVYYEIEDNDCKVYVWKVLAPWSKLRSTVKANSPRKEAA